MVSKQVFNLRSLGSRISRRRESLRSLLLAGLCTGLIAPPTFAQTTRTWDSTHTRNAWLSARNWSTTSNFAGQTSNASATAQGNSNDIAVIGAVGFTGNNLGINMNTSSNTGLTDNTGANQLLQLGTIRFTSGLGKDLTIGKSDSTLNGNLRLNGGTVGSFTNVILVNESSFNVTIANTAGGSGTMGLQLGNSSANTIVIGSTGNIVISNIISSVSGSSPLVFQGTGDGRVDVTNSVNTFTGNISILGAEVRFTTDGSMGNAANDIVIDGGRFGKASDGTTVTLGAGRTISVGDGVGTSISSAGAGTLVYNGVIDNKTGETGSWAKQGAGILELGGASTYTGSTAINNGTLRLTTGNDRLPTGTVVSLGQAASANLGTFDLNGRNQQIAGLNSVSGTYADDVNNLNNTITSTAGATLTLGGSGTYSFGDGSNANSGVITNAISIVKSGTGTQTFGDANTYTGTTSINNGVLNIRNGSGLGATTAGTTVASGAALELQGGISIVAETLSLNGSGVSSGGALRNVSGNNTYGGLVTLTGNTRINSDSGLLNLSNTGTIAGTGFGLTVGGAGNTEIASIIGTGSGSLTKDGSGTLTLTAANTFNGETLVSAGTLGLNNVNALQNSTLNTGTSGSQSVSFGVAGTNTYNLGGLSGSDDLAIGANTLSVGSNGANTSYSGILSSTGGGLTKTGNGTLVLGGSNSYVATTISAGTLQVGSGGTSGTLGTGAVLNNAALAFNRSDSVTIGNIISGSGSLTQSGSGTTILTGANSYGATTISAGTLQVGNGGTSGSLGSGAVSNSGTLVFNRSDAILSVSNVTGSGAIQQSGSGTTTLNGTNSSGSTLISAGTLAVNGTLSSGTFSVANAGTLQGTGIVTAGTVNVDGVLAPGNSIGTMAFVGNVDLTGGTLEIEYDGSFRDLLTVTGNLDLTGASLNLDKIFGGASAPLNQWFVFAQYGTLTGTFGNNIFANPSISPYHFVVDYNYGGGNQIAFSAVPEPSSLALIGLTGVSGLWVRWRRKKKNDGAISSDGKDNAPA